MTGSPASARRWWVLATIGIAQLMVVLDNSIVNIALPSAQADLGFGDAQRQWVVTAYALAFGSLLLIGGRVSDLAGRRAAFAVGLVGFGAVSVLGGLAPAFGWLIAARALQGVFGALLAPAALSLLSTTFPSGPERATAFGVFSGLAASGAATGLLLGGALTEYVSWRSCLWVNAVFAAVALVGAAVVLPPTPGSGAPRPRLDLLGTLTVSAGLFCVVFGLATSETAGWAAPTVTGPLVAGVLLLVGFVLVEARTASPLLPLRVPRHRHRGGAYLTIFVLMTGMFASGIFMAYVLQQVLGFSPVLTGVAFLPQVAGVALASNTVPRRLLPRLGPRPLLAGGVLIVGGGLLWFSFLTPDSTYLAGVLGPFALLGLGLGTALSTAFNTATLGVEPGDTGVASAMAGTMQQVGGSVGTALLSSVAGAVAAREVVHGVGPRTLTALHGDTAAFATAAVAFAFAAVLIGLLVPGGRTDPMASATPASVSPRPEPAPGLVGRVALPAGSPPGVTVTLTLIDAGDGRQVDRTVVDTGLDYRLTGRRPGHHLLVVGAPGTRPSAESVVLATRTRRHDPLLG